MANEEPKSDAKRGLWKNPNRISLSPGNMGTLMNDTQEPQNQSSPEGRTGILGQGNTALNTSSPSAGTPPHGGGWISLSARRSTSTSNPGPAPARVPQTSRPSIFGMQSVHSLHSLDSSLPKKAEPERYIMVIIDVPSINAIRKMKHALSTKIDNVLTQLVKRNPELKGDIVLYDTRTGILLDETRTLGSYLLKEGDKLEARPRPTGELESISLKIKIGTEESKVSVQCSPETKLRGLVLLVPNNRFSELDAIKYSYKNQPLLLETLLTELGFSEDDDPVEIYESISGANSVSNSRSTFSLDTTNEPKADQTKSITKNLKNFKHRQSLYNPRNLNANTTTGSVIVKIQFDVNQKSQDARPEYVNKVMSFDLNHTLDEIMPDILKRFPVDNSKNYRLLSPKAPGKDKFKLKPNEKIAVYNINNNDLLELRESKKPKKDKEKEKEKEKERTIPTDKKTKKKDKKKEKKHSLLGKKKTDSKSNEVSTSSNTNSEAELDPETIDKVLEYLEKNALELEGLFRLSAHATQTKDFSRMIFNREVNFEGLESPHVVSCGLKQYFRDLPQPLFPADTYSKFIAIGRLDGDDRVNGLKDLVQKLPEPNKTVAFSLFTFLKKTSEKSDVNMMIPGNLGIVFGPTLLRSDASSLDAMFESEYQNKVVETLISQYPVIFAEQLEDESSEESEASGNESGEEEQLATSLEKDGKLEDASDANIQQQTSPSPSSDSLTQQDNLPAIPSRTISDESESNLSPNGISSDEYFEAASSPQLSDLSPSSIVHKNPQDIQPITNLQQDQTSDITTIQEIPLSENEFTTDNTLPQIAIVHESPQSEESITQHSFITEDSLSSLQTETQLSSSSSHIDVNLHDTPPLNEPEKDSLSEHQIEPKAENDVEPIAQSNYGTDLNPKSPFSNDNETINSEPNGDSEKEDEKEKDKENTTETVKDGISGKTQESEISHVEPPQISFSASTVNVAANRPVLVAKSSLVNEFLKSQSKKQVIEEPDDEDEDDDDYDVEDDEDDGLKDFEDDEEEEGSPIKPKDNENEDED